MAEELPDAPWAAAPAADLPDAPWAAVEPAPAFKPGGFQQRQHAARGMIRAGGPENPAGQEALEPDLSGERRTPEQIGEEWRQAGKGALGATAGLGFVGDLEGLGRQAVDKLTPWSPSLTPEDQYVPPSTEGGMLGPHSLFGLPGAGVITPAKDEAEAKNMNIGAMLTAPITGRAAGVALSPVARAVGAGAGKLVEMNRAPRPPSREALINAELDEMKGALERRKAQGTSPTVQPRPEFPIDTGMEPREVRGANVELMPPDTPHLPMETPPALSSAGAAGRSIAELHHPEALRMVQESLRKEGFTPEEFTRLSEEEMSPNQFMLESGNTPFRYARGIAQEPGQGSVDINQSFRQRGAEAPERISAISDRYLGERSNVFDEKRLITEDQKRAASAAYNRFRSTEIPMTPALQELMDPLEEAGAFKKAERLNKLTPGAGPFNMEVPTAQTWDLVKRSLDSKVGELLRKGDNVEASKLIELKRLLVGAIDNHPDANVRGVWATAREAYAGPQRIKDAIDLGGELLTDKVKPREFAYRAQLDLNPEEIQGVLVGLRGYIEHQLGGIGRNQLKTLDQLLTQNNLIKLQSLLGEENAANFVREIRHEFDMHHSPRNIIHNSHTSEKIADRELWQAKPSLVDKGLGAAKALAHPLKTGVQIGVDRVAKRVSAAKAREAEQIRNDAARLFLLQGPARTAVGRYLLEHELPPRKNGGRVIKRAEGGRAPKLDYDVQPLPKIDRHEMRASVPLSRDTELTGRAYAYPQTNGVGAPVSPGPDWGAMIGLRRGFEEGGTISGWVDGVADQDEPGQAQAARETAARGVARGAQHHVPLGLLPSEGDAPAPPEAFPQKTWMFEPDLQGVQSGTPELPHGAVLNDAGQPFYPDTGRKIDVLRRPGIVPFADTPDGVQFVMPKLLDLASNVVSPLAAGRVPVKAGEVVLGSGAMRTATEAAPAVEKAAEPFYSTLERAVEGAKLQKGTPEQWAGYLRNQPGVKADEMDPLLGDWLKQQKGPITKEQLAEHIRENKVEVQEVAKGKTGLTVSPNEEEPHILEIYRADDPTGERSGMVGEIIAKDGKFTVNVPELPRKSFATQAEAEDFVSAKTDFAAETKYHNYQLYGGKNYREKLLTLPPKGEARPMTFEEYAKDFIDSEGRVDPNVEATLREQYNDHKASRPLTQDGFKSGHWDEPNVLAHVRMNDRMVEAAGDNAPRKSLHLEEIQSDWHQQGRKRGYQGEETPAQRVLSEERDRLASEVGRMSRDARLATSPEHAEWERRMERITEINEQIGQPYGNTRVPDAPFKKTWHELALKSALRDAVEGGYDRLSWTPGEAQAARYDLSKHVNRIKATRYEDGSYRLEIADKNGGEVQTPQFAYNADELPGVVGKDMAQKIVKDIDAAQNEKWGVKNKASGNWSPRFASREEAVAYQKALPATTRKNTDVLEMTPKYSTEYSGLDLKVGGEGMNGFYDQIVPKALEKLTKKYGVKVKSGEIDASAGKPTQYSDFDDYQKAKSEGRKARVHYIDIPQALKDDILKHGQPLFARGGAVKAKAKRAVIETAEQLAAKSAIRRAMNAD